MFKFFLFYLIGFIISLNFCSSFWAIISLFSPFLRFISLLIFSFSLFYFDSLVIILNPFPSFLTIVIFIEIFTSLFFGSLGILFLIFSLAWTLVLLLSTYGSFFAKSIFDEATLNNIQVLSSGIIAPTMVTIGISSWILSIFMFFWAVRLIFHLNAQTFFNRVVFLPILAAFLSVCASCFPVTSAWPHSFGLGGLFGDTILTFLVDVVSSSFGFGLKTLVPTFIILSSFTALFVLGFDKKEIKTIIRIICTIFLRLLKSAFKATTYICINMFKFLFFQRRRNKNSPFYHFWAVNEFKAYFKGRRSFKISRSSTTRTSF